MTLSLGAGLTPAWAQSSSGGGADEKYQQQSIQLVNLGHLQYKKKDYAEGDKSFRQAVNAAAKLGKTNAADTLERWAQVAEFEKHDQKKAEELYKEALGLFKDDPQNIGQVRIVAGLAQFYRRQNQTDKANQQDQVYNKLKEVFSKGFNCPACGRG